MAEPLEWRMTPGEMEMIPRFEVDKLIAQARADALEEAAKVAKVRPLDVEGCDDYNTGYYDGRDDASIAIRDLKEKQP